MADQGQAGVVVFFDVEPALDMLNDGQKGRLFSAILAYAHYSSLPVFDDPLLQMAWSFIKPSIDRANKKYSDTREKRKISGLTSNFKRNYAPKHGINPDDEEALQAYLRQRMSTNVDFEIGDVDQDVDQDEVGEGGSEGDPGLLSDEEFDKTRWKKMKMLLTSDSDTSR